MRRIIILSLLCLTAFGGVAAADRYYPQTRDHRSGGGYVQPHRHPEYNPRYQRYQRPVYRYQRPGYTYARPTYRYVRRPIYVQRPVIAHRYYNYYQRPAVVVENYAPRTGYYWVPGHWDWSGVEWIWNPGHYEPDANYNNNSGYDYNSQPYDNSQPYNSQPYSNGYDYNSGDQY